MGREEISAVALYLLMGGMLATGTANTLLQKVQDETKSNDGNVFNHPYFQTAVMFTGEFSCMGLFGIKRFMASRKQTTGEDIMLSPGGVRAQQVKQKTNINPLLIAIPATCDFMASTLMFIALTMVPASIYQMMRGLIVVITALLSVIFLGRKLYRHHWTAIFCIVAGVTIVGAVALLFPEGGDDTNGSEALGILLLLGSQLFAGAMFIIEEKLLGDYYLDPFLIVGTEGMWGLCYYLAILTIMQLVKCNGALCNFGYLENSSYVFEQYSQNGWLVAQSFGIMASIACFNSFGIAVTKYASAAQRSTIDTSRTLLIWIFSCWFLGETFHWQAIPGFVLLVFGTLLFNEIIVLPCAGFDQNTKEAIAKRARENGEAEQDNAYVSLSPHAAYDTKRAARGVAKKTDQQRGMSLAEDDLDYQLNTKDGASSHMSGQPTK